jgi:enhancer of mRNA-decapping protein 4
MRDQQQTLPDRLISQMRQSGTMTPVCHTPIGGEQNNAIFNSQQQQQDTQMQITQHLKKGAINSAFQVALCAADLNLLENLCELVSPSQAFDPKSKLQQPVILSLIQQLGQDLSSNTELKIKYLEDAMVNLDLTLPLTIEHTPIVMNQLVMKLQQHIQMHPNDKMTRQCKMLLLASKSLNTQNQSYSNQGHTPINYLPVLHHDQLVGKSTLLNIDLN